MKTGITIKRLRWQLLIVAALAAAFLLGRVNRNHRGGTEHTHDTAGQQPAAVTWTCSMHPQIKLPAPGKCPICFMDLIPLETGTGTQEGPRDLAMTPGAEKLSEIVTAAAERKKVFHEVRTVGFVVYDETRVRSITARIPGRIEKMHVDFTGTAVTSGQKLFDIYSPELYAAQEEYLQALKAANTVLIRAAREKLALWELTDGQINDLERAGKAAVTVSIHSPLAGVVVNKFGSDGMYVQTGMPVYTVADLAVVWIELDAYETDLPWVRTGQHVTFTTRAAPGTEFKGTVAFIDPVLDMKTRTVKVRVSAPNGSGKLKPGMFVSGTISSELQGSGGKPPLVIPATAPLLTGRRAVVYVRREENGAPVYEGREVVLGPRAGDYYVVASGLEPGERVVAQGAFKIDASMQIQAKPSMMTPDTRSMGHAGVPDAFIASLTPLYDAYFKAQQALTADDHARAAAGLRKILAALPEVKTTLLTGAPRTAWTTQATAIRGALQHLEHITAISGIREVFRDVSGPVIELEKNFGHAGARAHFVTFCPMAFDNRGGSWVQNHDTVANPYYGAAMLRCGEIKEEIKSR